MKTIGMLGGMSWESTQTYYRLLNEGVRARLGGLHSARILLWSADFAGIEELQEAGRWDEAGRILVEAAGRLEAAGADFLLICANTMHKVAARIEREVRIPLLHIADAAADEVRAAGIGKVGLLGTRFTMEEGFYRERLARGSALEVVVPETADRQVVHRVIYGELCRGIRTEESRRAFREIVRRLAERGCEGVVLGCTEISLLLDPAESPLRAFDTTEIHARRAVEWALGGAAREVAAG